MADRYLPAFLKACVSDASEEITALENLLWQRLLTAGFTINSSGQISTTVPLTAAIDPALLSSAVPVNKGGTALASGTSGGVLGFTASGTIASSVALTASALVLGGGAGATPTPMASLGTTTTVLHGNAAGAPTFGAVSLTADVSGILPTANGGTGIAFFAASGPTVARTYAFPDANATVLTSNAAVTVAQGGTGAATLTNHGVLLGQTTSAIVATAAGGANTVLAGVAGADPAFRALVAADLPSFSKAITADVPSTSSTLADVSDLTVTVLSSTKYLYRAVLYMTGDTTGGIKFGLAGAATVTNLQFDVATWNKGAAASEQINTLFTSTTLTSNSTSATGTGVNTCVTYIDGVIEVNAGGTLKFQFAQSSASGTSTLKRGGYVSLIPASN